MAVISVASAKGGCGKTTTALALAFALAQAGYKVVVLDADVNQHGKAFGAIANIERFSVVGDIDEENVLPEIRKASAEADVVIIDLPGGSSTLSLKAFQRSNLVLIPAQLSRPDVKDAAKTIRQVHDATELAGSEIHHRLVWTRTSDPHFESNAAKHVRQEAVKQGVQILNSELRERTAYREIHLTGSAPEKGSKAAREIQDLAAEVLEFFAAQIQKEAS